jgi:hypothetical protein
MVSVPIGNHQMLFDVIILSVPFLSLSVILWAISVEEIENVGTLIYPPVAELDSIWSCLDFIVFSFAIQISYCYDI